MKRIFALWLSLCVLILPGLARASEVPEQLEQVLTQSAERPLIVILGLVVVWVLTQLVKSERIPGHIPVRYRPLLAIVFGQLYALIEAVSLGLDWKVAMTRGFTAAAGAIAAHDNGASLQGIISDLFALLAKLRPPPGTASLLLVLVLGGAAGGCGSPLATAVHVADAGAAAADAAKPVLEQSCSEPMARAARLHDNDLALAVAAKCDAPMIAYEALRIAHVALRGAILEVYAGRAVEAALLAQVPTVAAAGARLAAAVQKLATGTVTQ